MHLKSCSMAAVLAAMICLPPAQAAPPVVLVGKTGQGATVDLANDKGKVVLLFFWSTECAVCLDQLPEMRRNLDGWRGQDFLIIAVNQDRAVVDLSAYERVLDRIAPPNPQMRIVWRRDAAYRDSFGDLPQKSPTTLIIDRKGALVKRVSGRAAPEVWDDVAELVLNCGTCK